MIPQHCDEADFKELTEEMYRRLAQVQETMGEYEVLNQHLLKEDQYQKERFNTREHQFEEEYEDLEKTFDKMKKAAEEMFNNKCETMRQERDVLKDNHDTMELNHDILQQENEALRENLAKHAKGDFDNRVTYEALIGSRWKQLQQFVGDLKNVIKSEEKKDLRHGSKSHRRPDLHLLSKLTDSMHALALKGRWFGTRVRAQVDVLFKVKAPENIDLFRDLVPKCVYPCLRYYFLPDWRYQMCSDQSPGGGINFRSLTQIRSMVEQCGINKIGLFPSSTAVANTGYELEAEADKLDLTFTSAPTDFGQLYQFDLESVVRFVVEKYDLGKDAQSGSETSKVMLAVTLDGAVLTKYLSHVTLGIKLIDPRSIDPRTGKPCFLDGEGYQTRRACFICWMLIGKDLKECYEGVFKPFFTFFKELPSGKSIPAKEGKPCLSNFNITFTQDLKSVWNTTGIGGGTYRYAIFCPIIDLFCLSLLMS